MPVVEFIVEWPDGRRQSCSSPSTVIHEHLVPGASFGVEDFVARTGVAMDAASERVRQRFGFICTAAAQQQQDIEAVAAGYAAGTVTVLSVGAVRAQGNAA